MTTDATAPTMDGVLTRLPRGERRTLAEVFFHRALPLLLRMAENAPADVLKASIAAPTDVGVLARVLTDAAARDEIRALDPLAAAFARGALLQDELLEQAGGTWTVSDVANHLKVSRQAVDKRRRRGTLLAVRVGDVYAYPVCQFDESGVIDGLPGVLQAMRTESGWTKLSLLFSHVLTGDEETILEAVKTGRAEEALHAASTWGEHGSS